MIANINVFLDYLSDYESFITGGTVDRPNVSYIKNENSVQYFQSGIQVINLETNKNDTPVVYKINGKEYIGKSSKNNKGNYTHDVKNAWIKNSDKITIQSIKQENNDYLYFHGYWFNMDDTSQRFGQSEELKKYLSENPSIDITNLTSDQ